MGCERYAEAEQAIAEALRLDTRVGAIASAELLQYLRDIGVNHVGLNLKYGERPAAEVLEEVGQEVLPHIQQITQTIPAELLR